jgi:hypothetical protein
VILDFCLLLDASLSVFKRVDEESSLYDFVFVKDILVVDDIPLLFWSVFVSMSSLSSSSELTRLEGSFFQLFLFSSLSYCDSAFPLLFDCGLEISNYVSLLSASIYSCCYVMGEIWLLPFLSLTVDSMLYCFFFTLVVMNFHSPDDIQLVKLSLMLSGQALVLLSIKTVSDHIKRVGNSSVFVRYFKNILMEYHITTTNHTLDSLVVKVIPSSLCCWF